MVARDMQVGARRACGERECGGNGKQRDAHGKYRYQNSLLATKLPILDRTKPQDSGGTVLGIR
jgi:hypothetical protein